MKLSYLWTLTWRWFWNPGGRRHQVKRGLFQGSLRVALFSMSLGVGVLAFTVALLTGYEDIVAKAMSQSRGDVIYDSPWRFKKDLDLIKRQLPPGVVGLQGFWNTQGLITGPQGGRGILVEGVLDDIFQTASVKDTGKDTGPVEVSLGKALAEYLGVKKGEQVKLVLPGVIKGAVPVVVVELLSFGMNDVDSRFVQVKDQGLRRWANEHAAADYARRPGDFHRLRIWMQKPWQGFAGLPKLRSWIQDFENNMSQVWMDQAVQSNTSTWWDQKRNLFGSLRYQKAVLSLVMGLLALVAVLNMASVLVVLFLERDRDFSIMRAMGLTRKSLMGWLTLQGLGLGLVGSALGILGAWLGSLLVVRLPIGKLPVTVYQIDHLPFLFDPREQSFIFVFGALASTLVALLLAFRLSRLSLLGVLGHRR